MDPAYNKLDNPAWHALTETHASFAVGNTMLKKYREDIVAFAAYDTEQKTKELNFDDLINPGGSFFIIGALPVLPTNYTIETILPCWQMVCTSAIHITATEKIEKLGGTDDAEMLALINLVQPGYYKPGTRLMGDYYGIRHDNELVAITGERMRMNGFSEISAVVTHPGFSGRGLAQQLVAHVTNKNLAYGIIPFLHVAQTNERAVKLYEYLGYTKRRGIDFTKIRRTIV